MILTSTSNLENLLPVLDWNSFLSKMETLEAQKRDKIPAETLMAWFNTLKANSWDNARLEKQISVMLKSVTFGSIKIDDFFSNVDKITIEESNLRTMRQINSMIAKGEKLLANAEINFVMPEMLIDKQQIYLAIEKRIRVYMLEEINEDAKQIISETIDLVSEKLGYKKVQYEQLSRSQEFKSRLKW